MFAKNTKRLRLKNKITQEALAFEIGVAAKTVSDWETGKATPKAYALQVLADFFSVSVETLTN